ncbi:uncharacterized protein PHALS_09604 [Plasmopara halstedii]|uniref:Uncharacterized protein n=1 Tax=Plasmopara halstedii TaxID=4781 RepID=A0A0P1AFG5_PLAHL|nr:uncharacterized protein PHALS_09604 [Plasmopara halstedii]CEG39353.1 hypothetical protein PHALS_09604 [Plasmopara halstedii]|eukprot:XP_024575722.1 hypothetical protein PHALS_09604 [Plasmopara halstedii]
MIDWDKLKRVWTSFSMNPERRLNLLATLLNTERERIHLVELQEEYLVKSG